MPLPSPPPFSAAPAPSAFGPVHPQAPAQAHLRADAPPAGTERLRLRRFTPRDQDALVQMHRDPRVRELLIDDLPFDQRHQASIFLSRLQAFYDDHPGLGIWAAEHWVTRLSRDDPGYADAEQSLCPDTLARLTRPQPRFIGWFNLMPMPGHPGELELGSRLMPTAWGTGLSMEGSGLLLDHAFGLIGHHRVWAVCHPRHDAAHLRLRMLGFEPDGERPYDGGPPCSHFVITAAAWQRERARPSTRRRREALAWLRSRAPASG